MVTVPGSPRRHTLSVPVRDNKQGNLEGPETHPPPAPEEYGQEVWVVLPQTQLSRFPQIAHEIRKLAEQESRLLGDMLPLSHTT